MTAWRKIVLKGHPDLSRYLCLCLGIQLCCVKLLRSWLIIEHYKTRPYYIVTFISEKTENYFKLLQIALQIRGKLVYKPRSC